MSACAGGAGKPGPPPQSRAGRLLSCTMIRRVMPCLIVLACTCAAGASRQPPAAAGRSADVITPGDGVPLALAQDRSRRITNVHYDLRFSIPADSTAAIRGRAAVRFDLADRSRPLALDFAGPPPHAV